MTTSKTTRRQAIALGLGIASVGAVVGFNQRQTHLFAANNSQDFPVDGNTALKERAAAKKLLYGAATSYFKLNLDANFATSFLKECAILMAEGDLLWCAMRPTIETFDFARADWFVEFAHSQNMLCGATHLVWQHCLPHWFKNEVNQQNAQKVMLNHIKTVVGRYAGKIHFWTVVNEAVNPGDDRDDGLTKTMWLEFLGPNYFDIAFRTAAEADPNALLLLNENDLEFDNAYQEKKRTALLKLLERLKSQGTPIHALGIQAHLNTDKGQINPSQLKAFLRNVAQMGLEIVITEMDVTDKDLPTDNNVRDRMVAQMYEDFLSVVLDEPATSGVITWGLSDRFTWLSGFAKRNDGSSVRPLPLDAQLNRKLAWNAIARAFDRVPQRDGSSKLWDAWNKLNQAKK